MSGSFDSAPCGRFAQDDGFFLAMAISARAANAPASGCNDTECAALAVFDALFYIGVSRIDERAERCCVRRRSRF
ncbi:hypothetical protein GCM10011507_32620 [Edaphobacter acidisoli]|uniref:Uncharacterized protein n=1 Tax=Edaphobacter acidisoli TaxID=2040573 RepID=A0A916S059_9BACT|nr:hypothetical protein GCM10011507_32620 [Edaphobacter acidisoli]